MKAFTIDTPSREIFMDVTSRVASAVSESGVTEGLCLVFVPHTTAGVTINENADPDVSRDIVAFLADMVPKKFPFRHSEGNSDAHVKASLMGSSLTIPVTGGRLALGTWQGIQFAEFDGPRRRKFTVTVVEGSK